MKFNTDIMDYNSLIKGALMLMILHAVTGYEMTKIFNSMGRSHTSSTIAWEDIKSTKDLPENVVPVIEGGPLWCRIRNPGIYVTGMVVGDVCRAPFLQKVAQSSSLEVMLSFNGFARLVPVPWDRLQALPDNAVTTSLAMKPEMLVSYLEDKEDGGLLPGYVDTRTRRGYFLKGEQVITSDSAIILTEMEPTQYILDQVKFVDEPRISFERKVLREIKLGNQGNKAAEISQNVNYTDIHRTYWGRSKGTVSGLEATVPSPLTGTMKILWNKNNNKDLERAFVLSKLIPSRQYIKVELIASVRTMEVSYEGILTAVFKDGTTLVRNVSDPHSEVRIAELQGNFSKFFYLDNDRPVQHSNESVEVLLHSSTTTTTTPSPYLDGMQRSQANDRGNLPQQVSSGSSTNYITPVLLLCFINPLLR